MRWLAPALAGVIVAASAVAWCPTARAQAQLGAPDGAAPPLSSDCQTPGISIAGDIPLPNVMKAIRERKKVKILAIGASASGGRDGGQQSYYGIIKGMLERTIPGLDVEIVSRGVSGELARDAAERLQTEVALVKPDLVLWQLGTHDALQQVPVDDFRTTVAGALDWLRQHDVDVVLVGLHYLRRLTSDIHYQDIRSALNRLAEEQKVLRIGRYEAMQVIEQARGAADSQQRPPNEFAMTEAGYSCLSEYVARAVASGVFARDKALPKPRG